MSHVIVLLTELGVGVGGAGIDAPASDGLGVPRHLDGLVLLARAGDVRVVVDLTRGGFVLGLAGGGHGWKVVMVCQVLVVVGVIFGGFAFL